MQHGDMTAAVPLARDARRHLERCERWGLIVSPGHHARLASACWIGGDDPAAERNWREAIGRHADDHQSRLYIAASLGNRGRLDLAEPFLREVTEARERSEKDAAHVSSLRVQAWQALGSVAVGRDDLASATEAFEAIARERLPDAGFAS